MMDNPPLINFFAYEKAWLDDDSRFKVGMWSRQIGKTFTCCAEIVKDCIDAEIKGQRVRWVILSRGERQAKEAMDEIIIPFIKAWYEVYKGLAAPRFEERSDTFNEADYKVLEVIFPSGSRITALPANPDTARGFSANVLLDEFAFHKDSRKIWSALFPVISKKGLKLRVVSTPNGKGNKFYDLMTNEESNWSRHTVTIHDAVSQGLDRDIEELKKACGDEDLWRQEFELEWMDEASAWLPYDLIASVEDEQAGKPERYQGGHCYIGNDIAARNDLWVAWVIERVGSVLWTREIATLKGASFAEQDQVLDELMSRYHVLRLAMDQTGMGEKPVEDATRRYGESRVNGVLFTSAAKQELATIGKQSFEDRKLRIPSGSPELRNDLHKLQKITGATGIPRFVAESDSSGHADRAWACFLALSAAAAAPYQKYDYQPVRPSNTASFGGYGGFGQHKGMF